MMEHIANIFILGLIGWAVPGSVLLATFTEILRNGFLRGLREAGWLFSTLALFFIFSRFRNILIKTSRVFQVMGALLLYIWIKLLYSGISYFLIT